MTFARLYDMQLIADTITHPRIYPHVSDDLSPAREAFVPCDHPSIYYLGAWNDSRKTSELSGFSLDSSLSSSNSSSSSYRDLGNPDFPDFLGLWMFAPSNSICWEVHTCLLPHSWGSMAVEAVRGASEYIWKNTECRRIITTVPRSNPLALRLATKAGMTQYGVNERSFLKNGELIDQILLGISKPEGNQCQ